MKKRIAAAFTAAVLTLLISFAALIAPSLSRPKNSTWTGTVLTAPEPSGIKSDVLTETGQNVFIAKSSLPATVTLSLESYGGASDSGKITVTVDPESEDWLNVEIDPESEEDTAADPEPEEDDTSDSKSEEDDTSDPESEDDDTSDSESEDDDTSDIETEEDTADDTEGEEPGDVALHEKTVEITENGASSITLVLKKKTPESGTEPDELKFTVVFDGADTDLRATFTVGDQSGSRAGNIDEDECSDYYGQSVPIVFTVDNTAAVMYNGTAFPEMTRYTAYYANGETETTLLYGGGYAVTKAAATVAIDLSLVDPTDIIQPIVLTGNATTLSLQNYENPPEIVGDEPFILDSDVKIFLTYFDMNGVAPNVEIKRLEKDENGLPTWQNTEDIALTKASDGSNEAVLRRNGADPGTYRINVSWTFEDVIIYERDVTIYVRYSIAE